MKAKESYFDSYVLSTDDENEFIDDVLDMEMDSEWISNIDPKACELKKVIPEEAEWNEVDPELARDTADSELPLAITIGGKYYLLRDLAKPTLLSTCRMNGTFFNDKTVDTDQLISVLQVGLSNSPRKILALNRRGKICALHADGANGYEVMSIGEMISLTLDALSTKFGKAEFSRGENSNGYTSCIWQLPKAQEDILKAYNDALSNSASNFYSADVMPAVRFSTSDTTRSCGVLEPVFVSGNSEASFLEGIKIKHSKRMRYGEETGTEAYASSVNELYAEFSKSIEQIKKLAETTIYNGPNAVVSLCNKYQIPKKWGKLAYDRVAGFTAGGTLPISAYDIFMSLNSLMSDVEESGMKLSSKLQLREHIAKVVTADWDAHDVPGTVAWGK